MLEKIKAKLCAMPSGVKASVAYTVCSVLQRCLSMLTMPLFTRLLTQDQYGQYTVYLSWMTIFTIFITLNLAYGSFSKAMLTFEGDRFGYISAVQYLTVVLAGAFLLLYFPLQGFWQTFFDLPGWLVLLMVAEIVFQGALLLWYGHRRFEFKYKGVVVVTLLTSFLSPVAAMLLVSSTSEKGYARIIGYAGVIILAGAVCFVYSAVRGGRRGFKWEYWRYALSFNLPLIPYYLSQVVFNQSDQIMIDRICGTDKVAIYGVAYTLATLLTFVLNAINNSYVPWFYGKLREGKGSENRPMASGIAVLMAFMLLGVIALAPEIISIMAGEGYAEAMWAVPPVAISILLLFYAQLFINVEFYYEKKSLLVWASIFSAVLNIALNAWLIPRFGFVAASYTTLVSYVAFAGANYAALRRIAKKEGASVDYYDLRTLLLIFFVFMALGFVAMALYHLPLVRYGIIAGVLVLLGVFHRPVTVFVKNVLSRK